MGTTSKPYQLQYKKKTATSDVYLPRGAAQHVSVCEGCHAVYRNKRWYADEGMYRSTSKDPDTIGTVCPACLKIRDNFPGGIVTLKGSYIITHRQELLNLIRNEEGRARGFNPLERVMSIKEDGFGALVVATTNEKLAQRLGRAIKKAFNGQVSYNWSHDNKLVRVQWERAA
jgi:hypothetical protein